MIDGESITNISGFLKPDDFYRERNRWCYEACLELLNRSEAINQVTVAHELETMDVLEEVGGSSYLNQAVSVVPTSVHIEYYGQIVHRAAVMRRLISVAGDIAEIGFKDDPDIDRSLGEAEGPVIFNPLQRPFT